MSNILDGRVALVTGASSGIGEATAIALAAEGAQVGIVARREERLLDLQRRIEERGGKALVLACDVTSEAEIGEAVAKTQRRFGRLDILVNNAGVMLLGPIVGADTEDWRRMVHVNLFGVMYATHAALPFLIEQGGGGHIVNVSSTAGRQVNPNAGVYSATKHAVGAFSEGLRREVYKHGIRVTLVEPGVVETELRDHITVPAVKDATVAWAASMRQLQAEDIASAILYAVTQPPHVNVNEILVRPTDQER